MPWVEQLSDPRALRRCIRDLVALSTLPAIWREFDPPQIVDSISAALLAMLSADFVYVALRGQDGGTVIEATHVGNGVPKSASVLIRDTLRAVLSKQKADQILSIPDPLGHAVMRIASAPIGFGGDAIIVAGSRQSDFPSEIQRLLLGIGANDTTVALQRHRVEADKQRFVALVERSSDFIGLASVEGRSQYINPAGLALVGLWSADKAHDLGVLDFIADEQRARARSDYWPYVLNVGRWTGELALRDFSGGAPIPTIVDWFRVDNPRTGQFMNMAMVARDLRRQKQAELDLRHLNESLERRVSTRTLELAQANDRLIAEIAERERADARVQEAQLELWHATRLTAAGHLAGALAHEMNQPLTAIVNSVNAARRLLASGDSARAARVPDILDEVTAQALRGGDIIRRLREFLTRGETEKRVENIRTMVEEACALALTGSNASGVSVEYSFAPEANRALANRIQVQQVIVNIVHNALDAMAGSAHKAIRVGAASRDSSFVEITIADSGPGLSPDIAGKLFQPFVSGKRHGMGLGLSISRSIVEAHGGRILAESNPAGGTILRFTLMTSAEEPAHAG